MLNLPGPHKKRLHTTSSLSDDLCLEPPGTNASASIQAVSGSLRKNHKPPRFHNWKVLKLFIDRWQIQLWHAQWRLRVNLGLQKTFSEIRYASLHHGLSRMTGNPVTWPHLLIVRNKTECRKRSDGAMCGPINLPRWTEYPQEVSLPCVIMFVSFFTLYWLT